MEQRILHSTKKVLNIALDDESFDLDVLTHINSAFFTLYQLGVVGPNDFPIEEDEDMTWADVLGEDNPSTQAVKTYVYLRARMLFDPPQTSYHIGAMRDQILEFESRLSVEREKTGWADPDPVVVIDE